MIRWRFVLTRVIIVIAVLALIRWSVGPLVHYASLQTLQGIVGAQAEIAQTEVGFFPPRLRYTDVKISNPRRSKAYQNAFAAEQVEFVLDGKALLDRRFVVSNGRISGIRTGEERETSGHLEKVITPKSDEPSFLARQLSSLGQQAIGKLHDSVSNLETVQRSEEIRRQWKDEYESLASRASELEKEIRVIIDDARGIDNPLRDLPRLQATIERANKLQIEAKTIRDRMNALPQRVQADWLVIEEAKRNDLAQVQHYIPGPVDSMENLGPGLLGEIVRTQVQSIKDYLSTAREVADLTVLAPEREERCRGANIALVPGGRPTSFLVRHCQLDGAARINGDSFTLKGAVENLTTQTERLQDPLRARFRLEGPRVVRVDFQRFYNEPEHLLPRDVLTVHWPKLQVSSQQGSVSSDLRLTATGGDLDLFVQIEAVGEYLQGQLISRQSQTNLELQASPRYADLAIVRSLQRTVSEIDHLEVSATFEGTFRGIDLQLATSLSNVLSRGVRTAVQEQVADSKRQLNERIEQEHREHVQKLQQWLSQQHESTQKLLAKADQEIDSLKGRLTSELPAASTYLGRLRSSLK